MARTKTKGKGSKSKKAPVKSDSNPDITGIIYMATGVIFAIAIYTDLAGALSTIAQTIVCAAIGVGMYALPIYLIYFGFQYIKTRGNIQLDKCFFGITIMVIVIMMVCGTLNIQGSYTPDNFIESFKEVEKQVTL